MNVLEISRDNLNSYKTLVISMYYLMDLKFYRYIFLISWKTKNKYKSIPTLQLYVCIIWWVHCWLQRKTEEAFFFFFWEEWSAGIWRHDPRVLKMTLIPNLNKFDFDINNFQKSVECYIYCVYINEYYIIKLVTDKRL